MRLRFVVSVLISFIFLVGPAEAGLFSVSDQQVIVAGRKAHRQVMNKYGAWDNPEQQARVERLGRTLAQFSVRPDIHYRFYLLNSPILNAFATPDGSIHVTRGLATAFSTDDELCFILGHELTHVEKRHGKQQIEKAMQTQAAGSILLLALGQRGSLARLGMEGAEYWLSMKYSREFETQADEGGMGLLKKGGIDSENGPKALEHLFNVSKAHPDMLNQYFGSHPMPDDRIKHAKEFAADLKKN